MIAGLGIDLVAVPRFAQLIDRRRERALRRLFTRLEIDYCLARADAVASLAARFAAKEAFFKALGTGWLQGGGWLAVEVRRDDGAPELHATGRARTLLERRGVTRVLLSLTHTVEHAAAVVVLEAG